MAHPPGKYADFEGLRGQAVALRQEGLGRRQIRDRLHVDNNDVLNRLLEGEPPPERTKRPNEGHHGRLGVAVLKSADLHRRIEGWWYGIVGGATRPPD